MIWMTLAVTTLSEQVNLARHLTILALSDSLEMVCVCSLADAIALFSLLPLTCKTLHASCWGRGILFDWSYRFLYVYHARKLAFAMLSDNPSVYMLYCYAYVMLNKYLSFQFLVVSVGTGFSTRIIIGSRIWVLFLYSYRGSGLTSIFHWSWFFLHFGKKVLVRFTMWKR